MKRILLFLLLLTLCTRPAMAVQQTINVGTSANDGTGDNLRTSFGKVNSNFTELYGGTVLQPLDADLTALAAKTGTNTLYYRSGVDTWSAVTFSNGIGFSGGALSLGAITPTSVNGLTLTTSTGTITIANLKTLTVSNTLTFAGTDGSTLNIGTGGTLGTAAYTAATAYQAADADLTTYASITPSANVQTLLASADFAAFRTSLGLVIGTNVQAYDADLTTYAGITPSANVQTLLGSADYAAFRTSLGLVIGTNVQAYDADLTTWAGITPGSNVGTFLATPTVANLRLALSDDATTGAADTLAIYDSNGDLIPKTYITGIGGVAQSPGGNIRFSDDSGLSWHLTGGSNKASMFFQSTHDSNGGELYINSTNSISFNTGSNNLKRGIIQLGSSSATYDSILVQHNGTLSGTGGRAGKKLMFASTWYDSSNHYRYITLSSPTTSAGVGSLNIYTNDTLGDGDTIAGTLLASFVEGVGLQFGSGAGLKFSDATTQSTAGYVPGGTDVPVVDGGTGASTAAGAATNLGLGTGDSPQFTAVNLGHASDTTITRTGAGDIAVEGNAIYRAGGTDVPVADGGTGASTVLGAIQNFSLASPAIFLQRDDFMAPSVYLDASKAGDLGWYYVGQGTGAAKGAVAPDSNAWGVLRLTSGSASADYAAIFLGPKYDTQSITGLSAQTGWEFWFRFKLGQTTSCGTQIGVGSSYGNANGGAEAATVRYDTSFGDTNFTFHSRSLNTSSTADSGVAADTNWHSVRIWSTSAGTVRYRLYNASGVAEGSEQAIATNAPASAVWPLFQVFSYTTANKTLDVDFYGGLSTGLGR